MGITKKAICEKFRLQCIKKVHFHMLFPPTGSLLGHKEGIALIGNLLFKPSVCKWQPIRNKLG